MESELSKENKIGILTEEFVEDAIHDAIEEISETVDDVYNMMNKGSKILDKINKEGYDVELDDFDIMCLLLLTNQAVKNKKD